MSRNSVKELNMKRTSFLIVILFVVGFVRGDSRASQDPLVVNSKTIALKFENSRVRVLEATLKPGDKEKTHSHPAYVIYVIEAARRGAMRLTNCLGSRVQDR
jgi:hypothetical protein